MKRLILFILFLSLRYELVVSILYPSKLIQRQSTDVHPPQIDCHDISATQPLYSNLSNSMVVILKGPHIHEKVTGYACVGVKLITICYTHFFGYEEIINVEEGFEPSGENCKKMLDDTMKGFVHPFDFPSKECAWLKTTVVTTQFVKLTSHEVLFDAIENSYLEPNYLLGKCKSEICQTIFPNIVWFNPSYSNVCNIFEQKIELNYKINDNILHLWNNNFYIQGLDICILTFCDQGGLLINKHKWLGLNNEDLPKDQDLHNYLYDLKFCEGDKFELLDSMPDHYQYDKEQLFQCQLIKEKLILSKEINLIDLQILHPKTIGTHKAFSRNHLGELQSQFVEYKDRDEINIKEEILRQPLEIINTTEDKSIFVGYNGIFVLERELYYNFHDSKVLEEKTFSTLYKIPSIQVKSKSSKVIKYLRSHFTDLEGGFKHLYKAFIKNITLIIVLILLIALIILLLIKLTMRCLKKDPLKLEVP